MYKFMIYFISIFLTFSIFAEGMDFGDEGMSFGDEEVTDVKKPKKKVKKKKKTAKKKVKKESDDSMSFGDDAKEDEGMSFGDDTKDSKEDDGMSFGDDEADSGMSFSEEDNEKIKEDETRFDFGDDTDKKAEKTAKKDIIKIKKKPQTYIERGTYFKMTYGPLMLIGTPTVSGRELDEKELMGNNFILAFGFDINKSLSIELYNQLIMNSGQATGAEDILYARDIVNSVVGLGVNFNFLNKNRLSMNLNLHGGALFLDDEINVGIGGMLGMEYYLLLRHFSVLTSLSGDYLMGLNTTSISLTASVKYSF